MAKVKVKVLRGMIGDDGKRWSPGEVHEAGYSFAVEMAFCGKVAPVGAEVVDPVASAVESRPAPKRRTRAGKE